MKIEKLQNPYVRGNEGCSVSMIDLLEKINEIIDAMNGEHDPADIYSEDGRLIAKKDESEDERIRKWLVDYFSSIKETVWIHRDISCEQILAWLEKQKEQKPVEDDCQFIDEKFMETDFWKQYVKDSIIPGNKPTRQDIDFLLPQAKNLFALATKDMCNGCKDWSRGYNAGFANAEKAEREKSVIVTKQEYDSHSIVTRDAISAWSEEDKTHLNWIIECLGSWKYQVPEFADQYQSAIDFLKSLRPQPKQEWSEDDEKMLEQVVDVVYDYCPDPVAKYKLKDWLNLRFKSIRPCPSWKPSEEQMEALLEAGANQTR